MSVMKAQFRRTSAYCRWSATLAGGPVASEGAVAGVLAFHPGHHGEPVNTIPDRSCGPFISAVRNFRPTSPALQLLGMHGELDAAHRAVV
ncbi:hypothetical protein [Streptomyces sp. NPDC047065]|uniref:hypothetical protein n=1 Tax=Streptomyces sp. NPDC047065 TaxID=3154606 RepID=UPI00340C2D07